MNIDCNICKSIVDGKELGSHFDDDFDISIGLYICPNCSSVLLGESKLVRPNYKEPYFPPATRLWPQRFQFLDESIPEPVRGSIEDARKCYQAGVYSASAVLCGKALEYVTIERTGKKTLFEGLKILKEQKQIDERLFEWADALRKERNIGAHAGGKETEAQDASDVLDFAVAFCEYVYVLNQKYKEYLERKKVKSVPNN